MPTIKPKDNKKNKKKREEPRLDEALMNPGQYETTSETTFPIDIYLKETEGRWVIMEGPVAGVKHEKVVMRMWSYDEMIEMRKLCTAFDQKNRIHMIDNDALNRVKIQKLMVSWTFDKDNPRLKIHHVQGVLTDESWKAFTRLQTTICDYIINRMNMVYDYNG